MRLRLPLILLAFAAGVTLGACEFQTSSPSQEAESPPPPLVEAPAAEDVAEEATTPVEPEPAQQTAPPPTDTGDMGAARPSAESVQPDSETVFY
ncbi:MAG: hypothetical protein J0L52_07030 [Caulobacterales bacterium]|nr:hypothetical protein [Caulobacterales bacterium]